MVSVSDEGGVSKVLLGLERPNRAIVIKDKWMAAIEGRSVTLYCIHEQHLMLKDFDSVGMGNRLVVVELSHLSYKGRDYLLVFGNEKEDVKPKFKCIVYELNENKLRFIKKATLFGRETHKPMIMFDNYPGSEFPEEQFCLVVGGFEDYEQQHYNFSALQVHLHLLLEEWLDYPPHLTREVPFAQKHTITSGKALKVSSDIINDQCWLLFCTDYQTVSKVYLEFGQHHDELYQLQTVQMQTRTLGIRDEKQGRILPIHYSSNSLYLLHVPEAHPEAKQQIPYRIYWCGRDMEAIRSRPLT